MAGWVGLPCQCPCPCPRCTPISQSIDHHRSHTQPLPNRPTNHQQAGKRLTLDGLDVQSLNMVSKCADLASHLSVPAVPSLARSQPVLSCLHDHEVIVGPEGLHVGLEMGVADEILHPPQRPPLVKKESIKKSAAAAEEDKQAL